MVKPYFLMAAVDDIAQLLLADLEAYLVVEGVLGISAVDVAEILRDRLVIDDAADGGGDYGALLGAVHGLGDAEADGSVQADDAFVVGHDGLVRVAVDELGLIGAGLGALGLGLVVGGVDLVAVDNGVSLEAGVARIVDDQLLCALLGLADAHHGQVVGTEDHVLSRNGDGVAVLWTPGGCWRRASARAPLPALRRTGGRG